MKERARVVREERETSRKKQTGGDVSEKDEARQDRKDCVCVCSDGCRTLGLKGSSQTTVNKSQFTQRPWVVHWVPGRPPNVVDSKGGRLGHHGYLTRYL
ncbi:hypothetical protein Pmani_025870 [Petrolisthes manimaculis]|uniref:Uncharacterized protein n=1 Tax=Petrolisthes manimaculis TaxID=1843537 RepID=A0AAE1P5U3_9EUCA|nr:hypothetical protein Pmani_025870 [Petrolisthes manimaculis]